MWEIVNTLGDTSELYSQPSVKAAQRSGASEDIIVSE